MRVDLHIHSTASDGVYSPGEVVRIAQTNNLDVIALTDHDTIDGLALAWQAAASPSLEVLAGVELSSEDDTADRHILGYMFDPNHARLRAMLSELHRARFGRAEEMVRKLTALGLEIPFARVLEIAAGGSVGRPHVAAAMLERGFVSSIQDAFDRYIGDDGPAYVPHFRLTPERAIDLIHGAGGIAVLAHPGHYEAYPEIIEALLPLGLDGVEVYYYDHTPEIVQDLWGIARRNDLVMTVGSDFHRREGDGSARIGSVKIPPGVDLVAALKARAGRYR